MEERVEGRRRGGIGIGTIQEGESLGEEKMTNNS